MEHGTGLKNISVNFTYRRAACPCLPCTILHQIDLTIPKTYICICMYKHVCIAWYDTSETKWLNFPRPKWKIRKCANVCGTFETMKIGRKSELCTYNMYVCCEPGRYALFTRSKYSKFKFMKSIFVVQNKWTYVYCTIVKYNH